MQEYAKKFLIHFCKGVCIILFNVNIWANNQKNIFEGMCEFADLEAACDMSVGNIGMLSR